MCHHMWHNSSTRAGKFLPGEGMPVLLLER